MLFVSTRAEPIARDGGVPPDEGSLAEQAVRAPDQLHVRRPVRQLGTDDVALARGGRR
jgi:hypothetical protein